MRLSEVPAKYEELMTLLREMKQVLEEIRDGGKTISRPVSASVSLDSDSAESVAKRPSTPSPLPVKGAPRARG